MNTRFFGLLAASLIFLNFGCASYATPGGAANLQAVGAPPDVVSHGPGTDALIRQAFDKKPLAAFPASIAVVRVQAPNYSSHTYTGQRSGAGEYTVVFTRDVETPEQFERLTKLPQVSGIAPLGSLLLDGNLDSDLPLRRAAASLQADMLLIYTFDTTFTNDDRAVPLTVISLGLSPNKQVRVTSTASALLLDTRNGYVYGLAEATAQEKHLTSAWQSADETDRSRRAAESAAFGKLVGELASTWQQILLNRGKLPQATVQ